MPYDLRRLGLTDTLRCGAELRNRGNAARSVEEGAQAMAQFLYQELVDGRTGERACALVRCYATHAYESLPAELRGLARSEEHTSELQSRLGISFAVFCLKK